MHSRRVKQPRDDSSSSSSKRTSSSTQPDGDRHRLFRRGLLLTLIVTICVGVGNVAWFLSQSPAKEDEQESLRGNKATKLIDAFYERGYDKPATTVIDHGFAKKDALGLRGYYAQKSIAAGEAVIRLPADHLICETSLDVCFPAGSRCEDDEKVCEQRYLLFAAHVGHLRSKVSDPATDDWFRDFFQQLPQDFRGQHPFFATREELSVLSPSPRSCHFGALGKVKHEAAYEAYKLLHTSLIKSGVDEGFGAGAESVEQCKMFLNSEPVDRETFSWGSAVVFTRGFTMQPNPLLMRDEGVEVGGLCLAPRADMLNHVHDDAAVNTLWTFNGAGDMVMVASKPVARGAALYDSYGNDKPAEAYVAQFGFAPEGSQIGSVYLPHALFEPGLGIAPAMTGAEVKDVRMVQAREREGGAACGGAILLPTDVRVPLEPPCLVPECEITAESARVLRNGDVSSLLQLIAESNVVEGDAEREDGDPCLLRYTDSNSCVGLAESASALCAACERQLKRFGDGDNNVAANSPISSAFRTLRRLEHNSLVVWTTMMCAANVDEYSA